MFSGRGFQLRYFAYTASATGKEIHIVAVKSEPYFILASINEIAPQCQRQYVHVFGVRPNRDCEIQDGGLLTEAYKYACYQ